MKPKENIAKINSNRSFLGLRNNGYDTNKLNNCNYHYCNRVSYWRNECETKKADWVCDRKSRIEYDRNTYENQGSWNINSKKLKSMEYYLYSRVMQKLWIIMEIRIIDQTKIILHNDSLETKFKYLFQEPERKDPKILIISVEAWRN